MTEYTQMPKSIAAGIVKVMGSIKRLAKDNENKFQRYNYASIDAFLEAVGPLMAEAGIFIIPEEESTETVETEKKNSEGTTGWLRVHWSFIIGHTDGSLFGPLHRTVMVPASGAQAFGSAMSYAVKQFMRGLFCIPTGDGDDPDADKKQPLPTGRTQPVNGKKPSSSKGDVSEPEAEAACLRAVSEATTVNRVLDLHVRAKERFLDVDRLHRVEESMGKRITELLLAAVKVETKWGTLKSWADFVRECGLLTRDEKGTVMDALLDREQELEGNQHSGSSDASPVEAAANAS